MSSTAWRGQPALVNGDGAAWRGRRLRRRTRRRGGSLRSIPSSSLALNWTSVAAESAASSPCVPPPLSQAFSPSAALARDAGQRWRVVAVLGWPAGAERIRFGEVVGDLLWERDSGICSVRSGARCCRSCSRTAAAAASSGRAASTWSFDGMQKFFVHFHGLKDRRALKLAVGFGSTNLFHSATVQQFNGAFVVFLSGLRTHMGVDLCEEAKLSSWAEVYGAVNQTQIYVCYITHLLIHVFWSRLVQH